MTADMPQPCLVAEAVRLLPPGGVMLYPTETFYGIGCRYDDAAALSRIFHLKQRDPVNSLLLLIDGMTMLDRIAVEPSAAALALARTWWPGPLTLLCTARQPLSSYLVGPAGTVGCRHSSCAVASALVTALGCPLTSTSASLSGGAPPADICEISPALRTAVDLIVDAGPTPGGAPSTIVDTTGTPCHVVRQGAVNITDP